MSAKGVSELEHNAASALDQCGDTRDSAYVPTIFLTILIFVSDVPYTVLLSREFLIKPDQKTLQEGDVRSPVTYCS